jgi:hypothetical protein
MKRILIIICLLQALHTTAQTSWIIQPFNYEYKRGIFDSSLRVPVMNTDRAFFTNKDSIGLAWIRPDSVKLFVRFPGNIIKSIVTYDSIISLKNSTIQNQNIYSQSANYSISGIGSSALTNIAKTAAATFTSYLHLSHDGIDTSKKAWAIGMMGTPSTSGPTTPTGDSLKFRSCNNSGAYFSDVLTLTRQGGVYVPGLLTLGLVNSSASQLLVNGSANIVKDIAVRGLTNYTFLRERGIVTVTTDYTMLSTDLYVNVNNSANCTITLPLSTYSVFHIKKVSNNAATVTLIGPNGTELIDGSTSYVLNSYNESRTLHDNGSGGAYSVIDYGSFHASTGLPIFTPVGNIDDFLGVGYSFTITGNGDRMQVTINTGTGIISSGTIGTIDFATPFASTPVCVWSPGNIQAALGINGVGFNATSGNSILMFNSTPFTASSTYIYNISTGL